MLSSRTVAPSESTLSDDDVRLSRLESGYLGNLRLASCFKASFRIRRRSGSAVVLQWDDSTQFFDYALTVKHLIEGIRASELAYFGTLSHFSSDAPS